MRTRNAALLALVQLASELLAMPAAAQIPPVRIVSISAVGATHSLTPDGIDVLRVDVQNTTPSASGPVEVRCRLGSLTLSGRERSVPAQATTTLVLRVPRARRMEVPQGGTFARCSLVGGGPETTTMVYTGPALVPNLRLHDVFEGASVVVRDCESSEPASAGRPACAYLDPENAVQTFGPIGEVTVTTRCELAGRTHEDVRLLRELPTGEGDARTAGGAPVVLQLGSLSRGPHLLSCTVDATRAVEESDEADNVARLRVQVGDPTPRRHDVAIEALSARYLPWRGSEAPQPDLLILYVEMRNAGDALIVGGDVECVLDGARLTTAFGGLPPPRGYGPGERFTATASLALARGQSPPSQVEARCRARLTTPPGVTDADASNDARAGRIEVAR